MNDPNRNRASVVCDLIIPVPVCNKFATKSLTVKDQTATKLFLHYNKFINTCELYVFSFIIISNITSLWLFMF